MSEGDAGWSWFDAAGRPADDPSDLDLCRAFARCFAGQDGQRVIAHLARTILERRLPPSASDAELRQLEGQRCAIAGVIAMVERGKS